MLSQVPEWLTESRAAIAISLVAAVFTGMTLKYTRRLALNDTKKMERKAPVVEVEIFARPDAPEGWKRCDIEVRNLEQVSARLLKIRSKRSAGELVFIENAETPGEDEFAPPVQMETILGHRELELNKRLTSASNKPGPMGVSGNVARYFLYCKGLRTARDVEVVWEWADGQKK